MAKSEKHTKLIDDLAAVLFPFQESEEEQECFTDVGRQRVDEWIDKLRVSAPPSTPGPQKGGE